MMMINGTGSKMPAPYSERYQREKKEDLLTDMLGVPSQDAVNWVHHFHMLMRVHVMERCSIKQN